MLMTLAGVPMAEVRVENVSKSFDQVLAVEDIDLTVNDGEFVVLLGPTGAGKTTTLRLIAGLEKVDRGSVHIGGVDVTGIEPARRDVAFVFQQYSLYPHLSVFQNLAFPLKSPTRNFDRDYIHTRVNEIAELLQISHKLENLSTTLSGGEMQRVAIGRALVRNPQVYLMDEPLSSLDAKLRAQMRVELKRIQNEFGASLLYVTHDQVEAMTMADRIGVISHGKLVQIGTPRDIYGNPDDQYVASRLGSPSINLLPVEVFPGIPVPPEARTLGVRTEHIRLLPENQASTVATVKRIEHLGDQSHLHFSIDGHELVTLVDPGSALACGQRIGIELDGPLYFNQDGKRIRNRDG